MSAGKWESQADWERAALEPSDDDLGYPPDVERNGDPVVIQALDDAPPGWAENAVAAYPDDPADDSTPESDALSASFIMNESTVCDLDHWQ